MRRWASTCLLACTALAGIADRARAHRLDAQCFVRPGWLIQVESWYETGEPPPGARVEVFRADGGLLAAGKLDSRGVFVFSFAEVETLKVVVTSVGHRAETTVPAELLARATTSTCVACLSPEPTPFLAAALLSPPLDTGHERGKSPPTSQPILHRDSPFPFGGMLVGLGILLAVAALVGLRLRAKTNHRG
jgi:hypothetical protein